MIDTHVLYDAGDNGRYGHVWWRGLVTRRDGENYGVKLDTGVTRTATPAELIPFDDAPPASLVEGQRVMIEWSGLWYEGTAVRAAPPGDVWTVRYAYDGHTDDVAMARVRVDPRDVDAAPASADSPPPLRDTPP